MKKYILLFLCFVYFTAKGQESQIELNIPKVVTPEVASIIKYIEQPVSLSSGMVNVEIPIYELIEGDIRIPISISYATTGMKVREANGRLGIGWTLNAEPSVSRQINGLPDEKGYLVSHGKAGGYTHYFGYMAELADGQNNKDEDPDTFYYKLLNKSGKFFFYRGNNLEKPSSNVTIETLPFEPIKIDYTKTTNSLTAFTITDDNGYLYRFGGNDNNSMGRSGVDYINWKPTEIISPTNNKISLTYGSYNTTCTWNHDDYIIVEESLQEHKFYDADVATGCSGATWPYITMKKSWASPESRTIKVSSYYEGPLLKYKGTIDKYLSSGDLASFVSTGANPELKEAPVKTMESSSVKIEFVGNYFLDKINIIDKTTNTVIRSVRFSLSYFNQQEPNWDTKRKLDYLEILDKNGTVVEKYSFTYYNPSSTPNLSDKNIDHWGYYNGKYLSSQQSGVPTQEITGKYFLSGQNRVDYSMTIGEANKQPSLDHTRIGTLQSITYPTGRKTSFIYELNQYKETISLESDPIETAGGLRIAEISEKDPISGETLVRKFEYGENGNGAGILKHKVLLDNYKYEKVISYGSRTENPGYLALATVYASSPLTTLSYDGGSPVFYMDVAETRYTNDKITSKTCYAYAHPNSFVSHIPKTTMAFETGSPWSGGYLEEVTEFKVEDDNSFIYFKPIKKVSYKYDTYKNSTIEYGKAYRRIIFNYGVPKDEKWDDGQAEQNNGFIHQRFRHTLGCLRLSSEKTETYTHGIPSLIQEKNYSYNNLDHMYISDIKEYNSDNILTTTTLKYPQDITFTSGSEEEVGRKDLIDKNRINTTILETVQTGEKLWTNKMKYTKDPTSGITLAKSISSGKGGKLEERTVINRYYKFGKPAQITVDGNLSTILVWSYNKQHLIAEIQNATFSEVETAIKSVFSVANIDAISEMQTPNESKLKDGSLQKALPNALVTTYTYKNPIGITSTTSPSEITTFYEYDNAGRLKNISDKDKKLIEEYNYHYLNQ